MRLKHLHIYSSPHDGGGTVFVAGICNALAERGHATHLACRNEARVLQRIRRARVQSHALPLKNGADIASLFKLARLVRRYDVDIVSAYSGRDYPLAFFVSRLTKTACVFWRQYYRLNRNPLTRTMFKKVEMVVAVSEELSSAMRDELHVRPYRSVTIPNWVDSHAKLPPSRIAAVETKFALTKPHNIALIGNIHEGKGQKQFVEIALELLNRRQDLCFLIVGVTEQNKHNRYLQDVKARIDGAGRSDDFRFIEWQSDPAEIFAVTRIAVVPSRHEAFGRVAAESLAAGVPVVASATGGLREIIRDGVVGFLVEPGNVAEWVEKIERLLNDADLYRRFARAGRRYALRTFSRETVVAQIEEACCLALRHRGSPVSG